jgi:hypothetical protein
LVYQTSRTDRDRSAGQTSTDRQTELEYLDYLEYQDYFNYLEYLEIGLNFTILADFQNFTQISQFQPNMSISSKPEILGILGIP